MRKIYILDTNILLDNHLSPVSFEEHTVVVPLAVLEELDNIKMRKNDLSRDARAVIRVLEEIIGDCDGDLETGIPINGSGIHKCHDDARLIISKMPPCSEDIPNDIPDNIIINTALEFQREYAEDPDVEVVLISNDINMRLKAKGGGMQKAQMLRRDIVVEDTDHLPQGLYSVPDGWHESLSDIEEVAQKSCGGILVPLEHLPIDTANYEDLMGTWLYNEADDFAAEIVDFIVEEESSIVTAELKFSRLSTMKNRRCSGVQAKSVNQAIAINALLDKEKDVVVLFGAAGSGKTLLATAAATEMVKGKKNYQKDEIIFGKTMDSQFEEVGFLPGNEHEKLAPWAGAVYDNMEVIARLSKKEEFYPRHSIEGEKSAFIKLKNLGFMRGRSLNHRVLILDEAQNLNAKQMKTLLSRAGENCKVILMGNLKQIDNDYVSENSSGLTYICNKFAKWDRASIVHLEGVERSPLAAFVEENL